MSVSSAFDGVEVPRGGGIEREGLRRQVWARDSLWPQCKANSTLATFDDVALHDFWRSGDREGLIETALAHTVTALGQRPTRPTAGAGLISSTSSGTVKAIYGSVVRVIPSGGLDP